MMLSGDRQRKTGPAGCTDGRLPRVLRLRSRELRLIEALRALRMLHYSAWLARRWDDPAFPIAFPWFNTVHYWGEQILELREQLAALDEPPLELY